MLINRMYLSKSPDLSEPLITTTTTIQNSVTEPTDQENLKLLHTSLTKLSNAKTPSIFKKALRIFLECILIFFKKLGALFKEDDHSPKNLSARYKKLNSVLADLQTEMTRTGHNQREVDEVINIRYRVGNKFDPVLPSLDMRTSLSRQQLSQDLKIDEKRIYTTFSLYTLSSVEKIIKEIESKDKDYTSYVQKCQSCLQKLSNSIYKIIDKHENFPLFEQELNNLHSLISEHGSELADKAWKED